MSQEAVPSPENPAPPHAPGVDRFGHFVVQRLPDGQLDCIGRGGMGVTYRALDTQLDRLVALKVIGTQWLDDAEVRSRFGREARAAARLQHPNIASVLFQGTEGGACFYAMELVVGETLESYIKRNGSLAPIYALRLAHQIALALGAAARESILHRDLKPGNVMLTSYDGSGEPHAKVIDFGLAKVLTETSMSFATGGFLGTPEFASPEQCAEEPLDIRSDLYALGATLWFMLAGRPPFKGSALSVIQAQAGEPLPFEQLRNLPEPLQNLLERLLAKSPDDRPATPGETAREIEAVIELLKQDEENFEPLEVTPHAAVARPPVRATDARAASVKRTVPLLALALGVAAIAMGAALYFAGKSAARQRNEVPQAAAPAPAKSDAPFSNSLGMKFLPVPTTNVRMCVWETRVRDFAAFVAAAKYDAADRPDAEGRTWRHPGFEQGDDHPVVFVAPEDALAFCAWLTRTERAAGRIAAHESYQLPHRPDWDAASGFALALRRESQPPNGPPLGGGPPPDGGPPPGEAPPFGNGGAPGEGPRPGENPGPRGAGPGGNGGPPFLWGTFSWPPPPGAGNFADESAQQMTAVATIVGYRDGFVRTAPVGRFAIGTPGFFDLAGNVWELVQDGNPASLQAIMLGGSWQSSSQKDLRAHTAVPVAAGQRKADVGFRCVLGSELGRAEPRR